MERRVVSVCTAACKWGPFAGNTVVSRKQMMYLDYSNVRLHRFKVGPPVMFAKQRWKTHIYHGTEHNHFHGQESLQRNRASHWSVACRNCSLNFRKDCTADVMFSEQSTSKQCVAIHWSTNSLPFLGHGRAKERRITNVIRQENTSQKRKITNIISDRFNDELFL